MRWILMWRGLSNQRVAIVRTQNAALDPSAALRMTAIDTGLREQSEPKDLPSDWHRSFGFAQDDSVGSG